MTTHYSTKDFFRKHAQRPAGPLLQSARGVQDFDFTAIKETKIDPLFEAWMTLPEA